MVVSRLMLILRASVVLAVLVSSVRPGVAQEAIAPARGVGTEVNPLPRRFPRFTDSSGCRWGLEQDGALVLSGSAAQPSLALFRHAARLTVNGKAFTPQRATASPDASRVRLIGTAGTVAVERDIWIDRERGAARFCDTFAITDGQPATIAVTHLTTFDQPVAGLHRGDGSPLADDATDAREGVLAFLQNQPEGMSSAVYLLGDPKSKGLPHWKGKKNAESHAFEWKLEVPAQAATSLVTWIVQRPTLAPADIKALAATFFKNGRLLRPRLEEPAIASLVNFPARGLTATEDEENAYDPGALLAPLARMADRLGIVRGETDVYYMNPKSLLEGDATGGPLVLESRLGVVTVPMAEVAAVQGGGGRGRWPRVFLRDGHVLSGAVTLPEWKISGAKGWAITLKADTLEALVLRTSPTDGVGTEPPNCLAQLTSGEILPLRLAPETPLSFVTPWGPLEIPVGEVTGLWRVRQPAPAARLTLRDGTRLTVLPAPCELTGTSSRLGPVTLQATDLAALWPPGATAPDPEAAEEELTSLDDLDPLPTARAILRGSAVLVATLADPSLTLLSGGTETQLNTADLSTLERAEGSPDNAPVFTVTLSSGASFEGTLPGGTVALKPRGDTVWNVPLSHFLGWRQGETKETR